MMFIMKVFRPFNSEEKNIDQIQNILFFYLEHQVNQEKVK